MTESRDPSSSDSNETPNNTPHPPATLPAPPDNERLRDFEPEADTVRIERLTDLRPNTR